jgi:hypothetical protein
MHKPYAACELFKTFKIGWHDENESQLLCATNYKNNVCRLFKSPVDCLPASVYYQNMMKMAHQKPAVVSTRGHCNKSRESNK